VCATEVPIQATGEREQALRRASVATTGNSRWHDTQTVRATARSVVRVTGTLGESPLPLGPDREAAVTRIRDAFARGDISHQDLDVRLHAALTAHTPGELLNAVESLPIPAKDRELNIVATSGKIRRDGDWRVPRILRIESEFGKVRLDLSHATFESAVVDVELRLEYGWAKVTAPADAVVDVDGLRAAWKQPRYTPPRHSSKAGPLIRISGSMVHGRLTVRHSRP